MTTAFPRQTSLLAAMLVLLTGCASIISGRRADVAFETYPANAQVAIHDDRGRQITSFNTPGVATLKRQRRFFLPARYMATISAPGFQTAQVPIGSTLNPWILGNIVIGGVPGLVIDSATGAAWKPKRSEIHRQLLPMDGPNQQPTYSANDNLPPAVRSAQTPVDESSPESTTQLLRR